MKKTIKYREKHDRKRAAIKTVHQQCIQPTPGQKHSQLSALFPSMAVRFSPSSLLFLLCSLLSDKVSPSGIRSR